MGYVTLRAVELKDGSVRPAGQPIPEAATWENPGVWIRTGDIALVPDGKEEEFQDALNAGRSTTHLSPQSMPFHLQIAAAQFANVDVASVVDQKPEAKNDAEPASRDVPPIDPLAVPPRLLAADPIDLTVPATTAPGAAFTPEEAADGAAAGDDGDTEEVVDDSPQDPAVDPSAPAKPRIRRVRKARR